MKFSSKIQTSVLASLRANAFGTVMHAPSGERWTSCDATWMENTTADPETGARGVEFEQYQAALDALTAAGLFHDKGDGSGSVQLPPLMKKEDMFDVKTATSAELVAKFNELTPTKPVKRFTDRKTAEKRVLAALNGSAEEEAPVRTLTDKTALAEKKIAKAAKPKQPDLPGVEKKPRKAPAGERLDQRTVRHGVTVDGSGYQSVAAAFRELRLPMGRHIKFRGALKTSPNGQLAFEQDGRRYKFELVAR